jgi:hypothetical protein
VSWNSARARGSVGLVLLPLAVVLLACGMITIPRPPSTPQSAAARPAASGSGRAASHARGTPTHVDVAAKVLRSRPATLRPFPGTPAYSGAGVWHAAGRLVAGKQAVYVTLLVPPGGTKRAAIAWMNTNLLAARLYSGSMSPGGGPYEYTAPIGQSAASSLVAAFNGGFKMSDARGGYYTEGRMIDPLRKGAASLVIYANGSIAVGVWGKDVTMTRSVVAVRQNLTLLVMNGRPSAMAGTRTWHVWGATCPCGPGLHGAKYQWRSGLGVTADGALIYVIGPVLSPLQLAQLLVRAGAVRGMELDINPSWPVFATFKPAAGGSLAAPSNGTSVINSFRGPATFFDPAYSRDFVTMSARGVPGAP